MPDPHEVLGLRSGASFSESLEGFSRAFEELAGELLGADGDERTEAIDRWLALCAALEEQVREARG